MDMKLEKSCGAVVYRKRKERVEFLTVKSRSYGHWGFPKGHVEGGESERETAAREVREETGLDIKIDQRFRKSVRYSPYDGTLKTVVYFIGIPSGEGVTIQRDEIQDYRWLDYDETLALLTFDNDRMVLKEAAAELAAR